MQFLLVLYAYTIFTTHSLLATIVHCWFCSTKRYIYNQVSTAFPLPPSTSSPHLLLYFCNLYVVAVMCFGLSLTGTLRLPRGLTKALLRKLRILWKQGINRFTTHLNIAAREGSSQENCATFVSPSCEMGGFYIRGKCDEKNNTRNNSLPCCVATVNDLAMNLCIVSHE